MLDVRCNDVKYDSMSSSIIPLKISRLAMLIARRKHIPINAALGYIYDSPFYAKLYDDGAKWWYLDTESLYRQVELSWSEKGRMIPNNVIVFLTFCIEHYAKQHDMSSSQAYALFRRYRVDTYLIDGFDMLHTQGEKTIMHDIELFIRNHKKVPK